MGEHFLTGKYRQNNTGAEQTSLSVPKRSVDVVQPAPALPGTPPPQPESEWTWALVSADLLIRSTSVGGPTEVCLPSGDEKQAEKSRREPTKRLRGGFVRSKTRSEKNVLLCVGGARPASGIPRPVRFDPPHRTEDVHCCHPTCPIPTLVRRTCALYYDEIGATGPLRRQKSWSNSLVNRLLRYTVVLFIRWDNTDVPAGQDNVATTAASEPPWHRPLGPPKLPLDKQPIALGSSVDIAATFLETSWRRRHPPRLRTSSLSERPSFCSRCWPIPIFLTDQYAFAEDHWHDF